MAGALYASLNEPPPGCDRWTPGRKAAVVEAVRCGELSPRDAESIWGVQAGEIVSWTQSYEAHGLNGLSVSRLQSVQGRGR